MKLAASLLVTALALSTTAAAAPDVRQPDPILGKAGWALVTASEDVYVYMRAAEKAATGVRRVWTAYDSAGPREREGFTFRSVQSLGEFDCQRKLMRVVEETYHAAPALTGRTWKQPNFVPTPWAKPEPGSVGAQRMAYACRTLSET